MSNDSPTTGAPGKTRILVVDDITRNLQVVGTLLRNAGYEVMPTTSGAQALERVRVQLPDLILLDLMMPEMDGLEVCRRLKGDPTTRPVPVIFLTASNEMEHLMIGFEVGAVDYVTKPFNPPELLARVQTHVELRRARERLREMNEEKDEFMGIAAHDLRNPLGAIQGYAEMIREDAGSVETLPAEKLPAAARQIGELAASIRSAAGRMGEMVQNLLDVNRIERGEMRLNLVSVDLVPLAASVVEGHRARGAIKQQTIEMVGETGPLEARADASVMVQVLENLVSNAVKYSPAGKRIAVGVERREGQVCVRVKDEGPGLSEEDRKKLFVKFARLSAKPTGGESSTGLGLSIVKKMVEAMHGTVWCESQPGQGATFVVQVPSA